MNGGWMGKGILFPIILYWQPRHLLRRSLPSSLSSLPTCVRADAAYTSLVKAHGIFSLMPNTMLEKGSTDLKVATFYLHRLRTLMGFIVLGLKTLPAHFCLLPHAILCSLSSSFKIHGYAYMHVGYEIVNVWEPISSVVPMCTYAERINIPYHMHICGYPSVLCTAGLYEYMSLSVWAIMLYFYSWDSQILQKIWCAWHIVWTQ